MITTTNFYWNNNGKYQAAVEKLQELIPAEGPVRGVKNKTLERLRKAINNYYRLYNNGDFNVGARKIFGITDTWKHRGYRTYTDHRGRLQSRKAWNQSLYDAVELKMDEIILAAAAEQNVPV